MTGKKYIKVGNCDFFAIHFEEQNVYHAKIDTEKGWTKAQILSGADEIENVLLYPSEEITVHEFQSVFSEAVEKLSNQTSYY
jgi:hypothetical protein